MAATSSCKGIGYLMNPESDCSLKCLTELRAIHHSHCMACNDDLLRLEFSVLSKGNGLTAAICYDRCHCSYTDQVHGGILALTLDQAMTCSLLATGVVGVTGRFNIRYLRPVSPTIACQVKAIRAASNPPLYIMQATLRQNGQLKVEAQAHFVRKTADPVFL